MTSKCKKVKMVGKTQKKTEEMNLEKNKSKMERKKQKSLHQKKENSMNKKEYMKREGNRIIELIEQQ